MVYNVSLKVKEVCVCMRDGRKKVPIIPQNMICYNSKSGFGARGHLESVKCHFIIMTYIMLTVHLNSYHHVILTVHLYV